MDKSKFNLTNLSFNKKKENKINKIILKILKKQYKLIIQIYEKILTFEKTKIENNSEILFQQKRIKILKNSEKEQEYLEKGLNKYKIEKNWKNKVFVEFAFMYAKNGLLRFGILEEINEEEFTLLANEKLENAKEIDENKAEIYKKLTERELPFEEESAINNSALFTSIWNDGIELNLNIKMMKIIIKMAKNFKEYKELIIEREENDENYFKEIEKVLEEIEWNILIGGIFKIKEFNSNEEVKGDNEIKAIIPLKKIKNNKKFTKKFVENCLNYLMCGTKLRTKSLGILENMPKIKLN
uniref:Uncharacterized protein n=1 Tax=Meloidogyne enterolobii TaxID=390850 RepID=A0A6V7V0N6_MELEN|nr:unnamed protein product [Meloidogyne enterolobii]